MFLLGKILPHAWMPSSLLLGDVVRVVITILFCCLAIFLILPWWVRCSPFLIKSFLCFSYDLSHHTPHPFVLNLQLVYSTGYMLVSFFPFSLFNSLPTILLQASYQVFCLTAIHSSM